MTRAYAALLPAVLGLLFLASLASDCDPWMGETPSGHSAHTPHWTPDGSRVVFEHIDTIYIVNPDGTGLESILGGSGRFDLYNAPSISPDGQRIAYTTLRYAESGNHLSEVETSRLDGSDKRRLTEGRAENAHPVWSPNGTRIAYLRVGSALVTMAADGSDVRALTQGTWRYFGPVHAPAWSPDGRYIAFVRTEEDPEGITQYDPPVIRDVLYSVNADGSAVHRVAEAVRSESSSNALHLSNPAWSPDGLLTFGRSGEANENGVYIGNPDGSGLRHLVDGFGSFHVAWAPDSAELLFGSGHYVYAVRKDGAGLRKLLRQREYGFAWSPNGSRVASFIQGKTSGNTHAFVSVAKDGTDLRVLAGVGPSPSAFARGSLLEINLGVREQPRLSGCSTGATVPEPEANPGLVQDCRTLLGIRDTLAGSAILDWNDQTPVAEWEGVSVEGSPLRVTELHLYARDLTGTLPPKLNRLTALKRLRLGANWLTGAVPTELASLENLELLYAPDNYLSGRIPPEIGRLTRMNGLGLAGNSLQGSIPLEIGTLTELDLLDLSSNLLTGSIPRDGALKNLGRLGTLRLGNNGFSGSIPPELGQLHLKELELFSNELSGRIPSTLGNLEELRELDLSDNNLTGSIPGELGRLSRLQQLQLDHNDLSGPIPPELSGFQRLEFMDLSYNDLSGTVELGGMPSLEGVHISHNRLSGVRILGGLSIMYTLNLSHNDLTSVEGLQEAPRLQYLYLSHNALVTIDLSNVPFLHQVALSNNALTGPIPPELSLAGSMEILDLSHNELIGSIPPEFTGLLQLQELNLSYNNLSGSVPPGLYDGYRFRLILEGNLLEGCVDRNANASVSGLESCPLPTGTPRPTSTDSSGS